MLPMINKELTIVPRHMHVSCSDLPVCEDLGLKCESCFR